ncbi:hypothetical protein ACFQY5_20110 [Paeniroseomonas aquatica]|uniref:hypothetical protein n=1 Tax=Paeniroseomonas aquatica TaxID=373043 RepID=UPI003613CEEF
MRRITPATLKAWINDGQELAILDAREDGEFGRSHLFWANPCGLSRAELRARLLLPRPATRVVCVDGGEQGPTGRPWPSIWPASSPASAAPMSRCSTAAPRPGPPPAMSCSPA